MGAIGRLLDKHLTGSNAKLTVLEVGSYDVNGSVRPFFAGAKSYTGIDVRPGPGVDQVADGATFGTAKHFDVVIATEVLEHADDPAAIIANAFRVLKPGGLLIVTCAGPDRPPHSSDGQPLGTDDTYQNINPDDLKEWLKPFAKHGIEHNTRDHDLYVFAIKSE